MGVIRVRIRYLQDCCIQFKALKASQVSGNTYFATKYNVYNAVQPEVDVWRH
jgi:hypothetical protein